jgi:hypothetical protein
VRKETRGRESEASRAVMIRDDRDVVERPEPLPELTDAEADEWRALCNAVPADYFPPATWALVASYARHRVLERRCHELIERECSKRKGFDLATFRFLLRELRAETAAVLACLRSLRLTHLASYAHDRKPLPEVTPKPWLS